ncbi:MAG: two pore domain potassium channel family protein [Deltaproteobacteria bacterium]|nr:two pore domain potassium channel family protein [Deltaproteobacteria bacterium]
MSLFEPARTEFGGRTVRAIERAVAPLRSMRDMARLFSREGVFFYLFMMMVLVVAGAALFLAIESKQQEGLSLIDRLVKGNYWSVVTLASVGFGDITPQTLAGRLMTIVFILASIGAVAMFTATLTSALTAKKIREGRGLTHAKDYSDHLLILGWKKDMAGLLEDVLSYGEIDPHGVVVVADVAAEIAEDLGAHPALAGIRIIRGQHYSEDFLKLVNPAAAAAIIILADESSVYSGESEIDSKTVMTAMVLSKYVRTGHVVAEILDPSFEPYLRNTKVVDEIVFPRRYGRGFLRMSAGATGIVNAFNALVEGRGGARVATYRLPDETVGKTVDDVRDLLAREKPGALLIGLVENASKYYERKTEAIREAQRTPDMERLVANLQQVKMFENHLPRLNPPGSHVIQPYTLAVVIERGEG